MELTDFKQLPILGILRGMDSSVLAPLLETIIASGMRTVEITLNTPDAFGLIEKAVRISGDRLTVGAGTVLDVDALRQAVDSGASFIVMPVFVPEVMEYCRKNHLPVFPGALTPQEVFRAWQAGASMVKVFPASLFGPRYFKELKGPFDNVPLMAVGGVSENNVAEFFACGAQAVAVGASIFNPAEIRAGNFSLIEQKLSALVRVVKNLVG